MRSAILLVTAAVSTLGPLAAAPAAEPPQAPWLRAAVYLDREALARGSAFRAAVVLDLDRGYHVNATPPSHEFLIPVGVAPRPHEGIVWGDVRYPEGEAAAAEWSDTPVRFYTGRAIVTVDGTVAADAPLGPTRLAFTLTYQGCDAKTCYPPGERTLEVTTTVVPADAAPAAANQDIFAEASATAGSGTTGRASLPTPPTPSHERSGWPGQPPSVAASAAGGVSRDAAVMPPIHFEGEVDVLHGGLLLALPLLFLGGLALNATPCVFPLIPVTVNFFASQGESRPSKVLPLAAVYVLGLAATFALVGVLAAVAGRSLGFVLQTPWGVLAVVAVLATMMASSFGAFEIQLPSGAVGRLSGRRGLFGAAIMGMVMGAIAAPCVGPFLISLITAVAKIATEQSAARAVAVGAAAFFVVGLGLGLPYLVLGGFTTLIHRFPRGGGWLMWTRRLLGLALAGLILFFLQPYLAPAMFWPMVLALFLFAAVYLGWLEGLSRRPFSKAFWTVRLATAAALLVGGVWFYAAYAPGGVSGSGMTGWAPAGTGAPGAVASQPESGIRNPKSPAPDDAHLPWTAWEDGLVVDALGAGRGVLLYFGADWCTECRAWKVRLFSRPEVIAAAERLARLHVDVTAPPAGAKADFARACRGRNPPAVIVLDGRGRLVKAWREPPEADAFVAALNRAARNR